MAGKDVAAPPGRVEERLLTRGKGVYTRFGSARFCSAMSRLVHIFVGLFAIVFAEGTVQAQSIANTGDVLAAGATAPAYTVLECLVSVQYCSLMMPAVDC